MFLRQSTSQDIRFGPCLDITDGVTEETALTLAQADMRLSKDGGAFAQKNATGNATHDSDGWYSTTLNATDTATCGILILNVHQPANMLPVWQTFYVVEEAIYDNMFTTSSDIPSKAELDAAHSVTDALVSGIGSSAHLLQTTTIATLTTQADFTLTDGSSDDGAYDNAVIIVEDSATAEQIAVIEGGITYTGSTKRVQCTDPAIFTMAAGDNVKVMASLGAGGSAPTAAQNADAVLDELLSAHTTPGSLSQVLADVENFVDTEIADIQSRLPAALVSGRMDSSVGAMAANVLTAAAINANALSAAKLATDAIDKIRDGLLPTQNAAFSFDFLMVDSTDHVTPETGLTVAVTRSIDGAAFAAGGASVSEIANGMYRYPATASDQNGAVITYRFTSAGADDRFVTVITGGGV